MVNDFSQHCMEIAKRFLQTVVIVDDEARIDVAPPANRSLVTPDRHTLDENTEKTEGIDSPGRHSLDARVLVDSFAEHGLVCGVIAPRPDDTAINNKLLLVAKKADIVVLDWQFNGDNGRKSLSMLREILNVDNYGRLRLIAIYTGEQDISGIGKTIAQELEKSKWKFHSDEHDVVLCYQHCRIVIYAKSDISLTSGLKDRSVPESDVPEKLIRDFTSMTEGLLPSIALTSLTAIRENVHRVLDKFHAELDPAFLAHRACLPLPSDSQHHMVSQLASELHCIMDDAVAEESSNDKDMKAIKKWLTRTDSAPEFEFKQGQKLSLEETVDLLREGLVTMRSGRLSKKKGFKFLSRGFAKGTVACEELDHRLAWMMNFRTTAITPAPILCLGTVVRIDCETNKKMFFLCMRPKCDSVRLKGEEPFLLLPLLIKIEPKDNMIQLVLCTGEDTYQLVGVGVNASQWMLVRFVPNKKSESVIAEQEDDTGHFFFTDVNGTRFEWLGELKPEFAQRIAHRFASALSRVAVNNSEWLRRLENLSD